MSAPVDTSLTSLKEITAKIMAIITGARQLPLGHSHFSLTTQVSTLVADAVRQYGSGPYLPGLVCSCSRELIRVRGMTPQVWPNWHSIGYDDTCLLMHPWRSKVLAWEELGDYTFNLLVVSGPSVGPIPVDLPPSPVIAGPSTNPASESWEKGKEEVSNDSGTSLPTPKCAIKTRKHAKTTGLAKFKAFVELEDEEDSVTQPISCGVPEVVLPQLSPDVARTSGSPRSPRSLKKKPFGPATAIAGKHPEVIEPRGPAPRACPASTAPPRRLSASLSIHHPDHQEDQIQDPFQSSCQSSGRLANHWPDAESISGLFRHSWSIWCPNTKVPSSTSGVPHSALNVPMPDLHAMAMVIREGAARIAALEERVVEQDANIDTLQHLHEGLRHKIILRHPTFPLPDAQGDATSFLLHQPVPPVMSTPASALPPLIDLSMEGMEPNPPPTSRMSLPLTDSYLSSTTHFKLQVSGLGTR
ncbi:uncharacterized protein EDB93DRAFT_1104432 [Suillus bovinus]|uniref:uncharacterized protein n=1 Tax=Suillus bovinus TaxID=48563 RepID=UPI001B871066|nr:uncharacterized protein EDB93DRAFT_1104432 [Suillus bovinus]KAG2146453.1 hypothetical protein EDB93DRAFT_1104432 [Suillus bovinus]